jgi:hypothetical protein
MNEDIAKYVRTKEQTPELKTLLQKCKDNILASRNEMSKYYAAWDFADDVYRGQRKPDEQDKKAAKRKEPMKMILPMTKSQVETFVAFMCRLLTQRRFFWDLVAVSDEDVIPSQMAMATLERDLAYNTFKEVTLPTFGRAIAKYGVGILKETWWHDKTECKQMVPDPQFIQDPQLPPLAPEQIPQVEQVTVETKYLGNKVINVSPYNFFPDPSLPLTRFQEGEFCGSEEEQSFSFLEQLEQDGVVAGIEFVRRTCDGDIDRRTSFTQKASAKDGTGTAADKKSRYGVLTEVAINLVPAKTEIASGVVLDKNLNRLTKCLVWYVNDDRIVRIEPDMGYEHDKFNYSVSQYNNDGEQFVNGGLAEDIGALQETATWFTNAHVTSVRKVIDNRVWVDPKFVEWQDIIDRKTVIRTKPGASQNGMQKFMEQFAVTDVTSNHMSDVEILNGFAKEATGINETLLGQFMTGRRSATEARGVATNGATRLVLTISGIWGIALVPLGRRMLSNLRQGLDIEQLVRIYGETNTMVDNQTAQATDPNGESAIDRFLPVDKAMLVGRYDFEVFDGTLPSQRGAMAQGLREVLLAMASRPESIPILGFDPALILNEILVLSDVRNVNRLRLTPGRLQQIMSMAQPPANAGVSTNSGGPKGNA